ncbi:TetR family transcriptional regulator [Siminovitchia terrae]|uniref:TetR family transcriptional regulator n=1 Tax=Siminovitchia terrae TaxID=1914933 RepID=A0ABQ4L3B0_SIMTE|nr:TetR/AcrR family transcriptional regulator [Siminovitchia terrae]GIN93136.1 TetR family transcriptional regulator [Siminovitchia terrae]GIN98414.1 TetR family transcriptional regulator [Siminovitchia terrae]
MSTNNKTNRQKDMSFIEKARRAQIIECAIETIVEVGYAQASLGKIAKRANISKGVISYHFLNKEELLEQVVIEYYLACHSFVYPQIEVLTSPKDMLQKYIEAHLTFADKNRKHVFAVMEIVSNGRTSDGKLKFATDHDENIFQPIEDILRLGMREGAFWEFSAKSARVIALTIRQSIDGFSIELMRNPQINVKEYIQELVTIFDKATRK